MKHFLYPIIVFVLIRTMVASADSRSFQTLSSGDITVQYVVADSMYAKKALATLSRAFEEIAFDLQVTESETLSVLIVPSRSEFGKYIHGELPKWTGAFAIPRYKKMVVKSPRWDRGKNDFRANLIHELTHLLVHEMVGNKPIPRWIDEGLAIFYSREQKWKTSTALSKAMATHSLIPLPDIDYVLKFHQIKAELAYQESYSAVRYLLATYDIDAIQIILQGIRENRDLDKSFILATGSPFRVFEHEWIQYVEKNYKWFWLSDINNFIWISILLLVILAVIIKRIRNRRTIEEWEKFPEAE